MVGNISSAAQSISKGLTRLQAQEPAEAKSSDISSEKTEVAAENDGATTSNSNNSAVGARLASALGRLSGTTIDGTNDLEKHQIASKSVDVQISPEAKRFIAMRDQA